jgi:hypothetical protein
MHYPQFTRSVWSNHLDVQHVDAVCSPTIISLARKNKVIKLQLIGRVEKYIPLFMNSIKEALQSKLSLHASELAKAKN